MTMFLCLFSVWAISACLNVFIMMNRSVIPNILSLFIILCPVLNTIYTLCRFKDCSQFVKELIFGGLNDTWKKL